MGLDLAKRLGAMAAQIREECRVQRLDIRDSTTQIIPIVLGDEKKTIWARDLLLRMGLYVAAIRPPTVPAGSARLRLSLRADLDTTELALVEVGLRRLGKEFG